MKSVFCVLSGAVAVLALAVAPALAQGSDRGGSGTGGGGGGGHTGVAAAGGGGGGAVGGGGSASGGGMSSGGGGSASGGGGYTTGGSTSGGFSGGGGASPSGVSPMGGARPLAARGERVGRTDAGAAMVRAGGEARNALAADPGNASVPGGSRPNYGNPAIGSAVPRGTNTGAGGGGGGTYPDSGNTYWGYPYGGGYYGAYYSPWAYSYYLRNGLPYYYSAYDPFYMYGYGGFGLGFLYYDPFWFGGMPGGGGAASSIYYGASPSIAGDISSGGASPVSGWSTGGYSSSSGGRASTGVKGGLKLKVTPNDAEVYVDGSFMGRVDQYNGAFQRLDLPIGAHRVELRAKGYNNVSFEVKIEPRDIQSYHGTMQPLQPVR